ncbi:MAG: 30S ribosomal protein S8 [Nanoarchaeota archaeon]|nr:30S ribosomal protein S8 [Nanoarchaeota archaeon]
MSQDIVSDALNMIMNAKKARKNSIVLNKNSKLLRNILEIIKHAGYIDYSVDGRNINIEIQKLNQLKAIKPRFTSSVEQIEGYVRRYLPAKNFGFVIISTNKGLMDHIEAKEKNIGGCLIAYVY